MVEYNIFKEKFIFYFNGYNINYNQKIIEDFYLFTEYLLAENKKYNLTSIIDIDEIIVKHYIDSVIILKYFDIPENSRIIDVGTGAGFPALPVYIMRRDLKIAFLDSSAKKINFIKNAAANVIKTNNAAFDFYCGRAEDFGKDINIREKYNFAVSRAVARLNILCELAAPFIIPGGFFIAYKSKNAEEEINEAKKAFEILDLSIENKIEFNLGNPPSNADAFATPFQKGAFIGDGICDNIVDNKNIGENKNENKRVLVKIKKLNKTSSKYPRNFSHITKNPL
ncbi:MAG: 16S rRNA (guanine(527)-N(7))-methyltransferase RsmG [Oscillospiraceae bacterium]|nr:16S rRNA (guanine(527)-N(7))-methyltransferase RsmG [Oscillospiraceae bacterium]